MFFPRAPQLVSQLAHVELLSPRPQESVEFLTEILGLEVSDRRDQSVYLLGPGDSFHHTIKVTEACEPGLGHIGWRADGPEALIAAAEELAGTGLGQGWTDGDAGHGKAYRFTSPGGLVNEVFWEVDQASSSGEAVSARGCGARRIDHATVSCLAVASERDFFVEHLGLKYMQGIYAESETELAAFLTTNQTGHELGLVFDPGCGTDGLNHVAFSMDRREDIESAAAVLRRCEYEVEQGPVAYLAGAASFLYVREPGGNRIELCSRRHQVYSSDWPVRRTVPNQSAALAEPAELS